MKMKHYPAMLFLILAGCSPQPYDQISVWASTNAAPDPAAVLIGGQTSASHRICIQSDNARIQDLVRKIAEHEGLTLRFDAEIGDAFCTVNLSDVEPIAGLASILELHDCNAVQTNGMLIVEERKKTPEPGVGR
jgi:hypothetical protein